MDSPASMINLMQLIKEQAYVTLTAEASKFQRLGCCKVRQQQSKAACRSILIGSRSCIKRHDNAYEKNESLPLEQNSQNTGIYS